MIGRYTEDGATLQEIADETGRSIGTVHRHLRRADIKLRSQGATRRHPRQLPASELQRTAQFYRSGLTLREVAEILGVGESTVRYRLDRVGVRLRGKAEAAAARPDRLRRITQAVEDEIVRLYVEELWSQREIDEAVGVARTTVQRALQRRGVRIRDRAQATRVARGKPPGDPALRVRRFKPKDESVTSRDYGAGKPRGRVPASPLVSFVEAAGRADDGLEPLAAAAGVSERLLYAWRVGERRDATWDAAEGVLRALGRFWWEVYDPADAKPCETFSGVRSRDIGGWMKAAEMALALWEPQPAIGERVKLNGNTWRIESWDETAGVFWLRRVIDGERASFLPERLEELL